MLRKSISRIRASLTIKIFLITAAILIAACMATYGFLVLATPISYNSIMEDLESKRAFMLASELSRVTIEESSAIIDRFQTDHSVEVSIFDVEGNTVVIKMPEQPLKDDIYITTSGNTADNSNVSASIGVSTQFSFQGSDDVYKIVTMSMITPVNHTVEAMRDVLPILIVMILLISFLGASFYSHYITRPIVRLSILSQKMTGLDFSCHSNETRTDEIGVLGRNLDGLSCNLSTSIERLSVVNDKLQKDIDAERELEKQRTEFFTAVSHELKTPLTILSGQLSGMLEGVGIYQDHEKYLPRSLSVVRRMEKLVEELLVISRLEQSSGKESNEIILLSELLEEQIENISELAVLKSQEMETFIAPHVQISGDKDLIQKAVSNLLCNAVIYSPEKAKITVLLEEKRLIIKNTGVQIPQEALSHLFEPLYRVDSSRNSKTGGSGLGLYLVKMVLDRHGAVCMINSTANGVEAIVEFLT